MTVVAITRIRPACAAALLGLDGVRAWSTLDDPGFCAISIGGTEDEAHAAVVAELRTFLAGDWTFAATLMTDAPAVKPCGWCKERGHCGH
jgi:hypothetical protein